MDNEKVLVIIGVIVILVCFFAKRKSDEIFLRYKGVFGKPTAGVLMIAVSGAVVGMVNWILGVAEMDILAVAGICLLISVGLIVKAVLACPHELKRGLPLALIISFFGILGGLIPIGWNIAIWAIGMVPGMKWIRRFMIVKNKDVKEAIIQDIEDSAVRYEQEKAQREAEELQRQRELESRKEDLRRQAHQKGIDNFQVNSDGTRVKAGESSFVKPSDLGLK